MGVVTMIESFPARSEGCQNCEGPPRTPWRGWFVWEGGNLGLGRRVVCMRGEVFESPREGSGNAFGRKRSIKAQYFIEWSLKKKRL